VLCEIQSDLSTADEKRFVEKNKRFWSLGKHYFKVEYEVKVLIGPADIRFELWFDNQKLSRDQSIKVDWLPAPDPNFTVPDRAELPENRQQHIPSQPSDCEQSGHTNIEKKKGLGFVPGGLVSMARSSVRYMHG
jgi:hypothetical protein